MPLDTDETNNPQLQSGVQCASEWRRTLPLPRPRRGRCRAQRDGGGKSGRAAFRLFMGASRRASPGLGRGAGELRRFDAA
jgi:hypothetical protein